MSYPRKEKRNKDLIKLRSKGWSYRELAEHFNIDVKTVYQVIKLYERDMLVAVDK